MSPFERARKPEEKEVRRQAILRAARELASEGGPIKVSLNDIGRRSGVSKPNIYRYFESREEILLRLLVIELQDCVTDFEIQLASSKKNIPAVANLIVQGFLARPLLCQLFAIVNIILEHNISTGAIAAAKQDILVLSEKASAALSQALPWLSTTDAAWAMHTIVLYLSGLWPAAHPAAAAAEALDRPELSALKVDAPRDFDSFVTTLFSGLQVINGQGRKAKTSQRPADKTKHPK